MTRNKVITVAMLVTVLLLATLLLSSCKSTPNDQNGLNNDGNPAKSEESLNNISPEANKPAQLEIDELPSPEIIEEIPGESAILPDSSGINTDSVSTDSVSTDTGMEDVEPPELQQQETESSPPIAGEPYPGGMIANGDLATALLSDINTKRAAEGNNALVADGTLDEVAFSYAKELFMGGYTFRNATKFYTLPSGKQVYSLFANSGYKGAVDDFGYSVWYNSNGNGDKGLKVLDDYMKGTNLYQTRAIQGDYTKVGIACATSTDNSDPYTVVILMCLKD